VRVRLRFTKLGKLRFLGHRDLARCWERAIRKAELPIAYSEGFSPRPKMHFGLALPTGCESEAEYLDIDLREEPGADIDIDGLVPRLSVAMPAGIDVTAALRVADFADALQAVVSACTWRFEVVGESRDAIDGRLATMLATDDVQLTFERKGKQVTENVRPAILDAHITGETDDAVLVTVELATKPRSIRPGEFLAVFDPPLAARRICRIEQWTTIDGVRRPLLVPADASWPAGFPQAS
jgi:radical SAM-linked protein